MSSSSSSPYLDLSQSQFQVNLEGKYCYSIETTVNKHPIQAKECVQVVEDAYTNRVICLCNAISNAFHGYVAAIGATSLKPEDEQKVYNDIVRQFLNVIKEWELCDSTRFLAARQKALEQMNLLSNKKVQDLWQREGELLTVALAANACDTKGTVAAGLTAWQWALVALAGAAVLGLVIWLVRHRVQEAAVSLSADAAPRRLSSSVRRSVVRPSVVRRSVVRPASARR